MAQWQHTESYGDTAQLRTVHDLMRMVVARSNELQRPIVAISHNNPSDSIYLHAIVVYG